MKYIVKRIFFGVYSRRKWLILALFPALVFFIVSAVEDQRYTVSQTIYLTAPREMNPGSVHSRFSTLPFNERSDGEYPILFANEDREVFFRLLSARSVQIVYEGSDLSNGTDLVQLYVGRLRKSFESPEPSMEDATQTTVSPAEVTTTRALWRKERLRPLAEYLAAGILIVVLILILLEFADDSFKSERNTARYLKVPMLGTMPDINRLVNILDNKVGSAKSG